MGTIKETPPVKVFCGLITGDESLVPEVRTALAEFGDIAGEAGPIPFAFTDYYEREMGRNLQRWFFSFGRLVSLERIGDLKRRTNEIEAAFANRGGVARPVNLDPGYLTPAKMVLFSTKDYAHRLYLADGIHAEVTMLYDKGDFVALPWTYPDYQSPEYLVFFRTMRERLKEQLREAR